MNEELEEKYEMVNEPSHYGKYGKQTVDIMDDIWKPFLTAMWCKMTAFKYRMRMGEKPENPIQQEIDKENKYLKMYENYKKEWKEMDYFPYEWLDDDFKEFISKIRKNDEPIKIPTYGGGRTILKG